MKTATKPNPATKTASAPPSEQRAQTMPDRIRRRAYEIYKDRRSHGAPGDELSDWLQAERDLASAGADSKSAPLVESKSQARGLALLHTEA